MFRFLILTPATTDQNVLVPEICAQKYLAKPSLDVSSLPSNGSRKSNGGEEAGEREAIGQENGATAGESELRAFGSSSCCSCNRPVSSRLNCMNKKLPQIATTPLDFSPLLRAWAVYFF